MEPRRRSATPLLLVLLALLGVGIWWLWQREQDLVRVRPRAISRAEQPLAVPSPTGLPENTAAHGPEIAPSSWVDDGGTSDTLALATIEAEFFPATESDETTSTLALARDAGTGCLFGWVENDRGGGIADAKVTIRFLSAPGEPIPDAADDAAELSLTTSTTPEGNFRFDDVPVGHWSGVADGANFGTLAVAPMEVPLEDCGGPVRFRLEPEIKLEGRTIGQDGKAISGVRVRASRALLLVRAEAESELIFSAAKEATSKADGTFVLENLSSGPLRITAEAPGYATAVEQLTLKPMPEKLDVLLLPEAPFTGRVRNVAGRAVEGAELNAFAAGTTKNPLSTCKSTESGLFAFPALAAGRTVDVIAEAAGVGKSAPVRLQTGTENNVIIIGGGGIMEGSVRDLSRQVPLGGVVVLARDPEFPERRYRTRTRDDGRFRFAGIEPGSYIVRLRDERWVADAKENVAVADRKTTKGVDLLAYQGIEIRGHVRESGTGLPVAGAIVRAQPDREFPGFNDDRKRSISNASGSFSLSNMPKALYTLSAERKGFIPSGQTAANVRVDLLKEEEPGPVELRLTPGGRVEGTVFLPGGSSPARNATVELQLAQGSPTAPDLSRFREETDGAGGFIIEGIPVKSGVWLTAVATTEFGAKGRSTAVQLDEVHPYQSDVRVELESGHDLSVQVREEGGASIAAAKVELWHGRYGGTTIPDAWKEETGPTGSVIFREVPDGAAYWSASAEDFVAAAGEQVVPVPSGAPLLVELKRSAQLRGVVRDDLGVPFSEGSVTAVPIAPATGSPTVPIKGDGVFELSGMSAGRYSLLVHAVRPSPTGKHHVEHMHGPVDAAVGATEHFISVPFSSGLSGTVRGGNDGEPLPKFRASIEGTYPRGDGATSTFSHGANFESGTWEFDPLPPGVYSIRISAAGYLPAEVTDLELAPAESRVAPPMVLSRGGEVTFAAVDRATRRPVAGARGRIEETGKEAGTNAQGIGRIGPLEPGVYTLLVSHPEYIPAEEYAVTIRAGSTTDAGKLHLDRGAVLEGTVEDGRGAPISGASIEVRYPAVDEPRFAATNDAGKFRLAGLLPGEVQVIATVQRNRVPVTVTAATMLSAGETATVTMRLVAESVLRGRLSAAGTVDLSRAQVRGYPLDGDGRPILASLHRPAVENGRFVISGIPEGTWIILAEAPNLGGGVAYWFGTAVIRGAGGDFAIPCPEASLAMTARETANGVPIAGQRIRVGNLSAPHSGITSLAKWWRWQVSTDEEGRARLQSLATGRYEVVALNDNFPADVLDFVTLTSPVGEERIQLFFAPEPGVQPDGTQQRLSPLRR